MNFAALVGVALIAVFCIQFSRAFGSVVTGFLSVVGIVLLLLFLFPSLSEILDSIRDFGLRAGLANEAVSLVFRGLGIGLITRFAASVCQDCGQKSLGETVEYGGQIALVSLALPMILELAQKIGDLDL